MVNITKLMLGELQKCKIPIVNYMSFMSDNANVIVVSKGVCQCATESRATKSDNSGLWMPSHYFVSQERHNPVICESG